MPVKHVTPDYPPTMLIHGTEDTDVPYEQSVMMAEQFKVHGQQDNSVSSVAFQTPSPWSGSHLRKLSEFRGPPLLSKSAS